MRAGEMPVVLYTHYTTDLIMKRVLIIYRTQFQLRQHASVTIIHNINVNVHFTAFR